jgi:response regulator RpfG family c-di-GMP phosphodiesterase
MTSLKPIIPIIMHHHERFDGSGYPQGLKGEQIPIGARIVSVVDSFIAMISKRAYKQQLGIKEALEEIAKHKDTQFDPKVVDCFLRVMKERHILDKVVQCVKSE